MKRTHLILIAVYFMVALYFAAFNWDMFILNLNISVGFTVFRMPFIMVMLFAGLMLILLEWALFELYTIRVHREAARREDVISKLKAEKYEKQLTDVQKNSSKLDQLQNKIDQLILKLGDQENNEDKRPELNE